MIPGSPCEHQPRSAGQRSVQKLPSPARRHLRLGLASETQRDRPAWGGCQVFKSDCLGQTGTSHFGVWWKQPAALAWNFPALLHNFCLLALEPNRAALDAERCSAERPAQDKPLAAESSASAELSLDTSPPPCRPGLSAAQRAFQLTVSSSGHWCQFYWGPRREKWSVWKWKEEHLVNWSQQVCSRLGTSPPLPASFINS